jgi:hypothetical protein
MNERRLKSIFRRNMIGVRSMVNDKKKIKAIEILIKNGRRGSEWQEAGLLRAIEKIVLDDHDISSIAIEKLIEEASRY